MTLRNALAAAGAAATLALSAQAQTVPQIVVFDPASAVGLASNPFAATSFFGTETTVVSNGAAIPGVGYSWNERGFIEIVGAALGTNPVAIAGLQTDFSLYVSYSINGFQSAAANTPGIGLSGVFDLYAASGPSTFGFASDGSATVTNSGSPVLLASSSLDNMFVAFIPSLTLPGEQALISVSAMTVTTSNPAVQPTSSPLVIGAFAYHELSDVTFKSNGLAISGGTDIISFNTPVPEASASSMLLAGLAVMGLVAGIRRRRAR